MVIDMQDSGFIQKVFQKIDKLDRGKIKGIMFELAKERELYKIVFESMVEGVIVINSDRRIILINKAMEDFISISKDRLYLEKIDCCKFDDEIRDVLNNSLSSNSKIINKEIYLTRTDKTFTISILPLLDGEDLIGHIVILVDITEKKLREIQLRQAESLAALTTLSAGVAHEIKNPLTSIDIHIQLFKKEIVKLKKKNIDIKNLKNLTVIVKEEIDRLNAIVQDFLFAVRPMSLSLRSENINDLVKELIEFLKYELIGKAIDVVLELDENISNISVDPKYLKQALLNIIKNAMEAIHERGEIRIKTQEDEDGDVLIHIKDSGEGIPDNMIDKIFEPYYTTRNFGTGLGLVIVYKIIRDLGGQIKVRSKEGKGTIFSIKLPAYEKKKRLLTYEGKDESKVANS